MPGETEKTLERFKTNPSPSTVNIGPQNPHGNSSNVVTQPSLSSQQQQKDKEMEEKKQQILNMATHGAQQGAGVDREQIVDFREESGMSGSDYMDFLKEIKKRSPLGYDAAGFISGPSNAIQNFIKKGGMLGNILSSIFDKGKETGIEAIEKVKEVFTPNGGVTEVMDEVQGPLTGPNKFQQNYLMGDPLGLFQQFLPNNYPAYLPQTSLAFQQQFGLPTSVGNMRLANGGGLFPQPANDPIINSFNKTPLSVLEYAGGGVTPKNAAIELGIVEDFNDGVMGV
tara:strand:- start:776 stop:1624 length:849 start_codon:yes stop_codon:yes gene_type:complete